MPFLVPVLTRLFRVLLMTSAAIAFLYAVVPLIPAPAVDAEPALTPRTAGTILPGGADLVEWTRFGVLHEDECSGERVMETRTTLPLQAGTTFGWELKLKHPARSVHVREVFRLPQRPAHWGLTDDTHLLDDDKLAITDQTLIPTDGRIGHSWVVSEGDPLGAYAIQVLIDDVLVARFDFEGVALSR